MSALSAPFAVTHRKQVKTAQGTIELTYISWSQVADRLDEAAPGWAFEIRQLGDDWCWGRLTLDGRTFENIGYAENADQAWKKEALKDAVSDALKRCAALAGVGRYLYDRDAPGVPAARPAAPQRPQAPTPVPLHAVPEEPEYIRVTLAPSADGEPVAGGTCVEHGATWRGDPGDLWHKTDEIAPNGKPVYHRFPEKRR